MNVKEDFYLYERDYKIHHLQSCLPFFYYSNMSFNINAIDFTAEMHYPAPRISLGSGKTLFYMYPQVFRAAQNAFIQRTCPFF